MCHLLDETDALARLRSDIEKLGPSCTKSREAVPKKLRNLRRPERTLRKFEAT